MYVYSRPISGTRDGSSPLAAWHGLDEAPRTAKQTYASQSRVRELTDRGFQNIFYDRNKVIVVSFWMDSCRPCDAVAAAMASVAERYGRGRFANLVKFYHAQWDPAVNPRLHQRYGFKSVPVVFFYYTSTGRQPSKAAPLLEAALGGDKSQEDPQKFIHHIETILRRHGHTGGATSGTIAEIRGWSTSRDLIGSDDFSDVDRMLIASSAFQKYFADLYRANPGARFSRSARVVTRDVFDTHYQRINGKRPDSDVAGTFDRRNRTVYLPAFSRWLEVFLGSAVHEAVHFFSCPMRGKNGDFFLNYGEGITEGFTQFVAEEILKSQKVRITRPPYSVERALAAKLIELVGVQSMADDYFLCTKKVHRQLEAMRMFGDVVILRKDAEKQTTEAARNEKYAQLIRFLEGIRTARPR